MIKLSHASYAYGAHTVVEDATFEIEKGECLCLVGPNGSGKSTLIRGMLGLMPTASGFVSRDKNLKISYLAQAHTFERNFPATVWEIVVSGTISGAPRPFYSRRDKKIAQDALERLKIGELARERIGALSGGQQQRVMLARAIAHEPELLIMDEPCSALDPVITEELYQLFDELKREQGLTIFIATHDWDYVSKWGDRVLFLNRSVKYLGPAGDWHERTEEGELCK